MAGANAYPGAVIGNDFLRPRQKPQQQPIIETPKIEQPIQRQTVAQEPVLAEPTILARPFENPIVSTPSWVRVRIFNLRNAGLFAALVLSSYLLFAAVTAIKHTNTIGALGTTASSLQQRVSDNIHHTPSYISLPQYSLAVENSALQNDISNIKAQPVVINFSFAGVNPTPAQIASWLSTSAGPKAGTTVLSVNTTALTKYLNTMVSLYDRAPTSAVVATQADGSNQVVTPGSYGISYYGVSSVTKTLASKLLAGSGASVSLSSKILPYQTVVNNTGN